MLHYAESHNGGTHQELGLPTGRSMRCTHPREVGAWDNHGEERTQQGPEEEQEFSRPEDTREGLFGDETISVSGRPSAQGLCDQRTSGSQG